MAKKSGINWTEATLNTVAGCTPVSLACMNCYAARDAHRMGENPNPKVCNAYKNLTIKGFGGQILWNGTVRLLPDRINQPLEWKRSRHIFVGSMSDTFHMDVPDEHLDKLFDMMEKADWHIFQLLTKRIHRAADYINARYPNGAPNHIWLGTTVESQDTVWRAQVLRDVNVQYRFLSMEPLLGPVDLDPVLQASCPECGAYLDEQDCAWVYNQTHWQHYCTVNPKPARRPIDCVIVGGESGPEARIMQYEWATAIRDACLRNDIPFHFKQWGEWIPENQIPSFEKETIMARNCQAETINEIRYHRVGKQYMNKLAREGCDMNHTIDYHIWQLFQQEEEG